MVVGCLVRGSKLHDEDLWGFDISRSRGEGEDECLSIEDFYPDQSLVGIRGSSERSEGASSATTEGTSNKDATEESKQEIIPGETTTKSKRNSKPVEQINIAAFSIDTYMDERELAERHITPLIQAMAASANPDILYYHEAMKAPDREKFILAMEEEVRTHTEGKHWKVVPRDTVPEGKRGLPSVCAMRRKRRLESQEVYK